MTRKLLYILGAITLVFANASLALAAKDFNIKNTNSLFYVNGTSGNVGVGSANPVEQLDVTGSMRLTGNVGIGTVNPLRALDVQGSVRIGNGTSANITSPGDLLVTGNLEADGNVWLGDIVADNIYLTGTTHTSGTVFDTLQVSGTTLLATTGGNVGIGTITTRGLLDVGGTLSSLVVTSSGNVGIGTSVPTALLQVGDLTNHHLLLGNSSGGIIFRHVYSTDVNPRLNVENGGVVNNFDTLSFGPGGGSTIAAAGVGMGPAGSRILALYTSNTTALTERMRIDANGNVGIGTNAVNGSLVVASGNVGIGSLIPSQMLDVTGTVRATNFIGSGSGLTGLPTGTQWTTTNTNDVFLPNNGNVGLGTTLTTTSALSVMNGNVGIGTWVPAGALMVQNGNVGIGTASPYVISSNNMLLSVNGNIGISGDIRSPSNSFLSVAGNNFYSGSGNFTFTSYNGSSVITDFIATNVGNIGIGTTTPMGGLAVMNGNVGIGTWVPVSVLAINGGTGLTITGDGVNRPASVQSSLSIGVDSASVGKIVLGNSVNGLWLWSDATELAQFGVNGVTYLGTSNVGIGTPNPQDELSVGGNEAIGVAYSTVPAPANGLIVQGNVGMGSLAPGQALDVKGTVRATNFIGSGSGLTGLSSSQWTTTNTNDVFLPNNGNVGLGTTLTTTSALTVMNGNVGIGTWVPSAMFQVGINTGANGGFGFRVNSNGDITSFSGYSNDTLNNNGLSFSNSQVIIKNADTNAGNSMLLEGNGGTSGGLYLRSTTGSGASDNILFQVGTNGGTEAMRIQDNSGTPNIGIGTSVPGALLDVEGAVSPNPTVFYGHGTNYNVGIGSMTPGQALDVVGTVRATNFIGSGSGLTGLPSESQWTTTNTNDVFLPNNGNVGLGTTVTTMAALSVMNGNVGIGTWIPAAPFQIGTTGIKYLQISSLGNLQISENGGTSSPLIGLTSNNNTTSTMSIADNSDTSADIFKVTSSATAITGNVGIFTSSGSNAANTGNTLAVTQTGVSSLTTALYISQSGTAPALAVASGNVGIGTSVPVGELDVEGTLAQKVVFGGVEAGQVNVGIGSTAPGQALDVTGTVRATNFIGSGSGLTGLSSGVSGLTTGTVPKAASSSTLNDSVITQSGSNIGIGVGSPAATLDVNGGINSAGTGDSYFSSGNLGVGTTTPQAAFVVVNGNVGIGTWTASSGLQVMQSFAVYRSSTAASATSAGQTVLAVTDTSSARTITLATADLTPGRIIIIKDESGAAGTNNITINTQGGENIDGASSVVISANYGVLRVYSNGSHWYTF